MSYEVFLKPSLQLHIFHVIRDISQFCLNNCSTWYVSLCFLLLFSNNCDRSRYSVQEYCPYKVVAHYCEICLHSYSLHSCYHYMTKVEHPYAFFKWMFHHGSNTGYTDIPADTLQSQCMSLYRSIHCAVYSPAFRAEISPVTVTYDSGKTEIDMRIMHIGRCY